MIPAVRSERIPAKRPGKCYLSRDGPMSGMNTSRICFEYKTARFLRGKMASFRPDDSRATFVRC